VCLFPYPREAIFWYTDRLLETLENCRQKEFF
jgi:hypothetical protein